MSLKAVKNKIKSIDKTRQVMLRLRRDVLDRFAAQAVGDTQVIEIPQVRIGTQGIHRPKLVQRNVFPHNADNLDLFAPSEAIVGSATSISCSAIQLSHGLTLLLDAISKRSNRSATMRYHRTAILWSILGLSEPSFVQNSNDLIYVAVDTAGEDLILASDLAYLTSKRGRMKLTPIHGERAHFFWNVAFHMRPEAAVSIFSRIRFAPTGPGFVDSAVSPVDVERIVLLNEGDYAACEMTRVENGELAKQFLAATLPDNTVLLPATSSANLGWAAEFLREDCDLPYVYELSLPRDPTADDYARAAELITGRTSVTSDPDRLTCAIERGQCAIVMVDSAEILLGKLRFRAALQNAQRPILFSLLDPRQLDDASLKAKIEESLRILNEISQAHTGGIVRWVFRTNGCSRPYFLLENGTVLGAGANANVKGMFGDLFKILGG